MKTGNNKMHDPTRQAGKQAEIRAAKRTSYKGMTQADIVRSLSDIEINKFAKRGAPNAIMEQAYRVQLRTSLDEHNTERSEFERTCMIEAEMYRAGGI